MRPFALPIVGSTILAGIVAALTISLALRQTDARPPSPPLDEGTARPSVRVATVELPGPQTDDYYAEITSRPLFAPTRRPLSPEKPREARELPAQTPIVPVSTTDPPPNVRLFGTFDSGRRSAALIGEPEGAPTWATIGTPIGNWILTAVGSDWAELASKTKTLRLEMYSK